MSSEEPSPAQPGVPALPPGTPDRVPVTGEIPYESTVTAPTRWVPYVYTEGELRAVTRRRGLSTASVVFGLLGLAGAIFGVWGAPMSAIAIVLAFVASATQRWAWLRWGAGLVTGITGLLLSAGWVYFTTAVVPRLWGP
jgi:hypothetical protein